MTYADCDAEIYLTFEDHLDATPPHTLVVEDEDAMFIKNVHKEIKGLSASEINNNTEVNYVTQEELNTFNSVAPFVVDFSTAQAIYDESVFVGVHQGNNTCIYHFFTHH